MHTLIKLFGYAGLIPFVGLSLYVLMAEGEPTRPLLILNAYAFGIICFLTGTWWGQGLASKNRNAIINSNLLFLVAFFGYVLAPMYWPLLAGMLLFAQYVLELQTELIPSEDSEYRKMRLTLTMISGCCMFLAFIAA